MELIIFPLKFLLCSYSTGLWLRFSKLESSEVFSFACTIHSSRSTDLYQATPQSHPHGTTHIHFQSHSWDSHPTGLCYSCHLSPPPLHCQSPAAAAAKSLQSCPTLCDPRDGSPPGSPIAGILQARTLEWVAISFSNA